ncbi:ABC transporter ATP-binding protein [Bacillus sp. HMF5848]|uniref:ABC transporter ATP-binding protein n=1 Tax=Bacillus sp. HMF5848 TaxID=2495421 RepID=UPI000F77591A|nr:ABC transporter ATP-binding protein [Bacillus sp. HMF5848]RSK27977.1 ABC transporter ATP-binding protein [Bacillus sp. HMF5848]
MITLEKVTKMYGNQPALDGVSIQIGKGQIVGILGPNGSGKSTTLKLIAGLIRPTEGVIKVNNQYVDRQSCSFISYMSELDQFYSFYTVEETIQFYASQFADFDVHKAHEILAFMKLDPAKKVKNLSKGNRGRLRLTLTLSRKVPVILLDEPLSGLDPIVRESIVKGLLSFINFNEQTIIITTHEVSEIEQILDRVLIIQDGDVIKDALVDELREEENVSVVEWMKKHL